MEMSIRADEISRVLKEQIKNYSKNLEVTETGTVLSVGDGVAKVYGLENTMAGELVEFPGQVTGMVLNLEKDSVGIVLFGEARDIKEGDKVVFKKYAPDEVKVDKEEYLVISIGDVMAVIE